MKHGCHNKSQGNPRKPQIVQDGYDNHDSMYRTPRYIMIGHAMSTSCGYTKQTPNDPACEGCKHQEKPNER